jgi:hypothetical protein
MEISEKLEGAIANVPEPKFCFGQTVTTSVAEDGCESRTVLMGVVVGMWHSQPKDFYQMGWSQEYREAHPYTGWNYCIQWVNDTENWEYGISVKPENLLSATNSVKAHTAISLTVA